jgi:hypothetical protein
VRRKSKIPQYPRPHQPPRHALGSAQGPALPPHLQAALVRMAQQPVPCLLCGRCPQVLGVFVPDAPPQWGVPPGWRGSCVYTLCQRCAALPDRADRVEAVLWRERAKAVAQWN